MIAERAAGNPFFAEEMVRELAQRGVLHGDSGDYKSYSEAAEVAVPETVQAAIEARIDRLDHGAKRTLNAASVIGARFNAELLAAVGVDAMLDDSSPRSSSRPGGEHPGPEYAFRHPLIRTVAYEAQLKANRAQWHQPGYRGPDPQPRCGRGERGIDRRTPRGRWRTPRGIRLAHARRRLVRQPRSPRGPAQLERARQISDALPADDVNEVIDAHRAADDAVRHRHSSPRGRGKSGPIRRTGGVVQRSRRQRLAGHRDERSGHRTHVRRAILGGVLALLGADVYWESVDDPAWVMGLAAIAFNNWHGACEFGEVLRWSQRDSRPGGR